MKKIVFVLTLFVCSILAAHSHEAIMRHAVAASGNYILEGEDAIVLLTPQYGVKKSGYRSFELADIVAPGLYTIAGPITRALTIASDNVTLDLGGYNLSGGLVIAANSSNVTVRNGVVDVGGSLADAIRVNTACTSIALTNVSVRNATGSGICFDCVHRSVITNCDLSSNTTGITLDSCTNIIIENCNALANSVAGFGLISSTTCSIRDCSALSTGDGNTQVLNQGIFGFVSQDGSDNIFDRCIANATQALSTTDFDSLVAGFALRGSESCSQIADCEAMNSQTSASGFTVPYGIVLEGYFDSQLTLTAVPSIPVATNLPQTVDWHPSSKYLALGGGVASSSGELRIYEFDRLNKVLFQIALPDQEPEDLVREISWRPDGHYLAVGVDGQTSPPPNDPFRIRIYEFDSIHNSLRQVATPDVIPDGEGLAVDWSSDGKFIAAGLDNSSDTFRIRIYQFDPVASTLTQVATPDVIPTLGIFSVSWHPTGRYVATGPESSSDSIWLYRFDLTAADELERVVIANPSPSSLVYVLTWSPDGKYLAAGSADNVLRVYTFDQGALTLELADSVTLGDDVAGVDWSSDGKYIAAAAGSDLEIYEFDRAVNQLRQLDLSADAGASSDTLKWSPDGRYIAVGNDETDRLFVYDALQSPIHCVVKNNLTYHNSGGDTPLGIGIAGNSVDNLIMSNTSYNNPDLTVGSAAEELVFTNYAFVTNIFNELFQVEPSKLQNLSLGGCVPIAAPADLPCLWSKALDKTCDIQTKVDHLSTLIP